MTLDLRKYTDTEISKALLSLDFKKFNTVQLTVINVLNRCSTRAEVIASDISQDDIEMFKKLFQKNIEEE